MNIICNHSKKFSLVDSNEVLGELVYKSIFSYQAEIHIGEHTYKIKTSGIFLTTIEVFEENNVVAELNMNWKGHIVFKNNSSKTPVNYLFTNKGFWNTRYVIQKENQEEIVVIRPSFNWKKMNYNYAVEVDKTESNPFVILMAAYCANYYIATMSGAIAAT
jgi:hypothetical protein